ncbi:hypothetical protein BSP38_222 [Bacillus phage BSP38]|uniref:Uncharacterized protein n=1 Tax=Bacillus phage BSP38 TaxID=2283013 RepID=A0A345MK82_BPBSP|nr:hypothetical protein HWB82_gp096 [Bacillus phage BSP38]AXH71264.1 hypothetical protein BSP38_222 [Bacillus phage BSP38]
MEKKSEEKVVFMLKDQVIAVSSQQPEANIRTGEICTMCKKGVMCKTSEDSTIKWCDNCSMGVIGEMKKP